jgi:hypothetical protein
MKRRLLSLACLFWLGAARSALAVDLDENVPGHAGLTYFDLAKLLVTDLAPGAEGAGAVGHAVVPFTHIEGRTQTGEPPETINLNSTDVEAMDIPGDPSRILLLVDLGQQEGFVAHAELLGLISLTTAPKLIDVVEVGMAESTAFGQKTKPIMLAARTPLILIANEHDNSDESFVTTEMIFVRADRFQLIGAFATFDEKQCAYTRSEDPSLAIFADRGAYPALHVAVRARIDPTGVEGCGEQEKAPRARTTNYQAVYRWDSQARRFVTRSAQLKMLAGENEHSP